MTSLHVDRRAWMFVLLATRLLQGPLAAQAVPTAPPSPELGEDQRHRITAAAVDTTLAPWQREIMLEVARVEPDRRAGDRWPTATDRIAPATGPASANGEWVEFFPPPGRYGHTMIYDPARDRLVVFGGTTGDYTNDVWVFSLAGTPTWTALAPAGGAPMARYQSTAIYDPVRDRMVVFGGSVSGGARRNDVWALSFTGYPTWSAITPSGTPPSARGGMASIYDPALDRMVIFAGFDGGYRNDVWALSLAGSPGWTQIAPSGSPPAARYGPTAIFDAVRGRMVVFGGHDGTTLRNDVWVLALAGSPVWSPLAASGGPPTARYLHAAIYDPVRDRMVLFGGYDGGYRNDVWVLSLAGSPAWTALSPAGAPPNPRYMHPVVYDPVRDRMMVFGGSGVGTPFNDVWGMSLAGSPAWTKVSPLGIQPSGRKASAIYDPLRYRMVVFGGYDNAPHNDVWTLSLAGPAVWSLLTPSGSPPPARYAHTAIYDPLRDRMVVFGGYDVSYRNDVWALSLAGSPAWSQLLPTGGPPSARYGHTAIYDPVRDRMVVFGGYDVSARNDVWALSLAGSPAWSQLLPTGGPPSARSGHTAIYDPPRDRMVVFGGVDATFGNDVWALSLAGSPAWSPLAPTGSPPVARREHTAIYDPIRDRMVMFGGFDGTLRRDDTWALSLAGGPAWSLLGPAGRPAGRLGHTAIYHPVYDRMVVFGGLDNTGYRNDVWGLSWNDLVAVPGPADPLASRSFLARPRPSPFRAETVVEFYLAAPGRVVLEVFDAQGRHVRRIDDTWFTAGHHQVTWRGDDDSGHSLGVGVYLIRMLAPGFEGTRRAIRLR